MFYHINTSVASKHAIIMAIIPPVINNTLMY